MCSFLLSLSSQECFWPCLVMSLQPWTCYDFEFYLTSWKTLVKVRQSQNGLFQAENFPKNYVTFFFAWQYYELIRSLVFWKNSRIPKSPFKIKWPLAGPPRHPRQASIGPCLDFGFQYVLSYKKQLVKNLSRILDIAWIKVPVAALIS